MTQKTIDIKINKRNRFRRQKDRDGVCVSLDAALEGVAEASIMVVLAGLPARDFRGVLPMRSTLEGVFCFICVFINDGRVFGGIVLKCFLFKQTRLWFSIV